MESASTFFDNFLVITALICSVIAIIDWLLGPEWQKQSRDALEDWWIRLSELNYQEVLNEAVDLGNRVLSDLWRKTWGAYAKVFNHKAIILLWPAMFSLAAGSIYGFIHDDMQAGGAWIVEITCDVITNHVVCLTVVAYLLVGWILLLPAYFFGLTFFSSLAITRLLMWWMTRRRHVLLAILLVMLDVYIAKHIYSFAEGASKGMSDSTTLGGTMLSETTFLVVFLIAFIPTSIHLAVSTYFLLGKTFDGVVRPLSMLLLLRITETKRGVLTQIAIGLGVIAKLVQEAIKLV